MELTKEHFDRVVADLATKQEVEDLAAMVQRGFADLTEQLDVKE